MERIGIENIDTKWDQLHTAVKMCATIQCAVIQNELYLFFVLMPHHIDAI